MSGSHVTHFLAHHHQPQALFSVQMPFLLKVKGRRKRKCDFFGLVGPPAVFCPASKCPKMSTVSSFEGQSVFKRRPFPKEKERSLGVLGVGIILLMAEILHQLIGSLSHCL